LLSIKTGKYSAGAAQILDGVAAVAPPIISSVISLFAKVVGAHGIDYKTKAKCEEVVCFLESLEAAMAQETKIDSHFGDQLDKSLQELNNIVEAVQAQSTLGGIKAAFTDRNFERIGVLLELLDRLRAEQLHEKVDQLHLKVNQLSPQGKPLSDPEVIQKLRAVFARPVMTEPVVARSIKQQTDDIPKMQDAVADMLKSLISGNLYDREPGSKKERVLQELGVAWNSLKDKQSIRLMETVQKDLKDFQQGLAETPLIRRVLVSSQEVARKSIDALLMHGECQAIHWYGNYSNEPGAAAQRPPIRRRGWRRERPAIGSWLRQARQRLRRGRRRTANEEGRGGAAGEEKTAVAEEEKSEQEDLEEKEEEEKEEEVELV
jgi:hypothetical protein